MSPSSTIDHHHYQDRVPRLSRDWDRVDGDHNHRRPAVASDRAGDHPVNTRHHRCTAGAPQSPLSLWSRLQPRPSPSLLVLVTTLLLILLCANHNLVNCILVRDSSDVGRTLPAPIKPKS